MSSGTRSLMINSSLPSDGFDITILPPS